MADSAGHENGDSWYSVGSIANRCECTKNTVRKHIKSLMEIGLIEQVDAGGGHKTNRYRITFKTPSEIEGVQKMTPSENAPTPSENAPPPPQNLRCRGSKNDRAGVQNLTPNHKEPKGTQISEPKKNPKLPAKKKKQTGEPKSRAVWIAYSDAYRKRYGVDPIRNAKVSGQLCEFVKRVGKELAPIAASHFLESNNQWYIQKGHSVGVMLADAEKIATEARVGQHMTASKAKEFDQHQTTRTAIQRVAEDLGE